MKKCMKKCGLIGFVISILFFSVCTYAQDEVICANGVGSVVVGMDIGDFLNSIPHKEVPFNIDVQGKTGYTEKKVSRLPNKERDQENISEELSSEIQEQMSRVKNYYVDKKALPDSLELMQCTFKDRKLYYIFVIAKSKTAWESWKTLLQSNFGKGRILVNGTAVSYSWKRDAIGIILGRKKKLYMLSYTDLNILYQKKV